MPDARLEKTREVYGSKVESLEQAISIVKKSSEDDLLGAAAKLLLEAYEHSEWLRQRQGEVHLRGKV